MESVVLKHVVRVRLEPSVTVLMAPVLTVVKQENKETCVLQVGQISV